MMKSQFLKAAKLSIIAWTAGTVIGSSTVLASDIDIFDSTTKIAVSLDNFIRAATDIEMGKYASVAGGANRLFHLSEPVHVDAQTTIRSNRDTLYSMAVVDISEGAELTLPDAGDRYMSVMVINQDHYVNKIIHGGGTYKLDMETYDTPFVILIARTLVDSSDPEDVKAVNALQDQMALTSVASKQFVLPNYDEDSFEQVLKATLDLARHSPDSFRTFGAKQDVDPIRHFAGTAFGWGGLPETEAFYLNVEPGLPVGKYKVQVADVPVDAFWSVTLYNARGFFEKNPQDAYSVNSVIGDYNDDGSMIIHFGGCDDGRANCLPIMEGWNYAVRMYQPRSEILDGSWAFPDPVSAE